MAVRALTVVFPSTRLSENRVKKGVEYNTLLPDPELTHPVNTTMDKAISNM